jgi:hypothetical protein
MGLIVNVPGGSEVQFQIRKRAMVKILTDNLATKSMSVPSAFDHSVSVNFVV